MSTKETILVIFGTRPEAIKMAPVIKLLHHCRDLFDVKVCVTSQHRQMLDQVLQFFNIVPDIDFDLMKPNQTLPELTAGCMLQLSGVLSDLKPSFVLVQGDTTTAFMGALAAFYQKVPVGHVEAGLRTNNIYAPFPEEVNRRLISVIAECQFAPTESAAQSLRDEGISDKSIYVTGNTIVDALYRGLSIIGERKDLKNKLEVWFQQEIGMSENIIMGKSRMILITAHRRESFGKGLESICHAIRDLSFKYLRHAFVYPVHLNPNVQVPVFGILGKLPNVFLIEPVDYAKMLYLMTKSYLILTDSGGIQEEAPSLHIPVLVMRDQTERPEGVHMGSSILVGNNTKEIVKQASTLLDNEQLYTSMQLRYNPYGDGHASEQIIRILEKKLLKAVDA